MKFITKKKKYIYIDICRYIYIYICIYIYNIDINTCFIYLYKLLYFFMKKCIKNRYTI